MASFNQGRWLHGHELFETLWLNSSGSRRDCLQGLIQFGAARIKLGHHNNLDATLRLLDKNLVRLRRADPGDSIVDTARLVVEISQLRDEMSQHGPEAVWPQLHLHASAPAP